MGKQRTTKKTTREMFVRTRRAWKDGSKIEIDFTSVSGKQASDYTVTLYNDELHTDTCTCIGFTRYAHCCHLDHFRIVEQLRTAMTSPKPAPVCKQVLIEALIVAINTSIGKSVTRQGALPCPNGQLVPGAGWLALHEEGEAKQREMSRRNRERFNAELQRIKAEQQADVA